MAELTEAQKRSLSAAKARAIAQKMASEGGGNTTMGFVNRGIANTVGGAVDFVNPFDNQAFKDRFGWGTGSAVDALETGMEAIGAPVADREPESITEGFAQGVGDAAGAIIPVAKGLQALRSAGGAVGAAADDAYRALTTRLGFAAEATAGGLSRGASEGVEEAGGGPVAQGVAAVAAPLSVPAAGTALRGGAQAAQNLPVTGLAVRAGRGLSRAIVPMSDTGARNVARERLQQLAGGEERASELGARINPQDEFEMTPAQQTGDPNMVGLEDAVRGESPLARERLDARRGRSNEAMRTGVEDMGGDVGEARQFFDTRLRQFRDGLNNRVQGLIGRTTEGLESAGRAGPETATSSRAVGQLKNELDTQLQRERALWDAVPDTEMVGTTRTAQTVDELINDTPWAQRRDIPSDLREAFGDNGTLGNQTTARELYGLYSDMRRQARAAMAGNDQNKNRARIANMVADAILEDLGAVDASTELGRAVNEARAFSRALHETFDQGAVGRILQRTIDGDERMAPEVALGRTVGRGGAEGVTSARQIEDAASATGASIEDYLRGEFSRRVLDASGEFRPRAAMTWMRDNQEMAQRYPRLFAEFRNAVSSRERAEAFRTRAAERQKAAERSPLAMFNRGQTDQAIDAVLKADNPIKAARSLAAAARKDESGRAMAGLKGAFTDYIVRSAVGRDGAMSGDDLERILSGGKTAGALRQVFRDEELARLRRIQEAAQNMNVRGADVGEVLDAPVNRLVDMVVRIAAARRGGELGGGSMGGSMQTANIFVERARNMLRNLTNDKARQLLKDAVEDPQLFRALLMEPKSVEMPAWARSKLAPYLTGAAAAESDRQSE